MIICWRIAVSLAFIYQLHFSIGAENGNVVHDKNMCSHIISFEDNVVVPVNDTVKEYYTTWCFSIPPRCTTYRLKTVQLNKTITLTKTKTVFDCCKGYEKISGSCKPICRRGCNHGECIDPEQCLCNEGWKGPLCDTECQPRRFGRGCENHCSCMHGATCDPQNGSCYCREGYIGSQCEFSCPNNTYGLHCINKCKCQNGALCDIRDGSCDCLPGYSGHFCEKPCDAGTHGENCEKTCICLNETTELCSHTDGKCICKAGYKGDYCEEECDKFTYGIRCENQCDCENSEMCNHITGQCLCKPGWIGKRCSEKCQNGTFGEDCKFKCLPCHNGSGLCDHETGVCECPAGATGESCDLPCPENYWGLNCSKICNCLNDGICHSVTGKCLCLSGWIGKDCSQSCQPGTYGFNCSMLCTCEAASFCDPEDGMCTCLEGYTGSNCEYKIQKDVSLTNITYYACSSVAVLLILLVIIVFCCYYMDEDCRKIFSKKLECIEDGGHVDIIENQHFSNPVCGTPELPEVSYPKPETHIYAAFEYGKKETEGLQRLKSFINQLTDEKLHSENIPDEEKDNCNRGSKGKQSAMNDLSTPSPRQSSNAFIRKLSKTNKNIPTYASPIETNEEYEPEGLCEFFIVEDNIYENVRYSKQPQEVYSTK